MDGFESIGEISTERLDRVLDDASFVNGAVIAVDGGWDAY